MARLTEGVTTADARPAWQRISVRRRWAMLGVSTAGAAASAAMVSGPAFLIPELHRDHGLSLAEAGLVASAPLAGLMLTLVGWGMLVDRYGERRALLAGLGLSGAAGLLAIAAAGSGDGAGAVTAMAGGLFVAGAASGASNSATARVVVGWFPPERRGLAMGIRQTAQPLGVGIAAATMAVLAEQVGLGAGIAVPTVWCLIGLVLIGLVVIDPPRPAREPHVAVVNPYRADPFLPRVHAASVLLVAPQFLVWTFGLTWMVDDLGWPAALAGLVMLAAQLAGAAARIGAGWYSDVAGSRMGPMRQVALVAAGTLVALGVASGAAPGWATPVAVVLLMGASAVTVADNGLAFTAIAERAGPFWAGRAMGVQNTAQHLMAAAVPPVAGLVITHAGYGWVFGLAGLLPLLAVPLVPVDDERRID